MPHPQTKTTTMIQNTKSSLLALGLLALAAACSTDADSSRGPDAGGACTSGCVSDEICLEGTSASACGSDGDTCRICDDGEVCEEGGCVPDAAAGCDATTCDGCCDGDVCLSGTSAGACGSGGAACADCGPRGVCAAAEENTCEVDPAARWNLIAVRATLPETQEGGGTWDPNGGLPDGYARGVLDDEKQEQTSVDKNTLSPSWNEPVAIDLRASELAELVIEVFDSDLDADDLIGRCTLPEFAFEWFDGDERPIGCPDRSGWQMDLIIEAN
jgi:hypothetical protein